MPARKVWGSELKIRKGKEYGAWRRRRLRAWRRAYARCDALLQGAVQRAAAVEQRLCALALARRGGARRALELEALFERFRGAGGRLGEAEYRSVAGLEHAHSHLAVCRSPP